MDCQDCIQLLSLYMDKSLSDQEREAVRGHLMACAPCRQELEFITQAVTLVNQLPAIQAPVGFETRLLARLQEEHKGQRIWFFWRTFSLGTVAAAAMVLVTLVVYRPIHDMGLDPGLAVRPQPAGPAAETVASQPAAPGTAAQPAQAATKREKVQPDAETADSRAVMAKDALEPQLSGAGDREDFNGAPSSSMYRPVASAPLYPVALQGMVASAPPAAPAKAVKKASSLGRSETLFRQKQEWSGEICAMASPLNKVVRSGEELQALWRQAAITSVEAPALRWNEQMLGVIFLGKRPGRGHDIQLRAVESQADRLLVRYHVNPGADLEAASSQPFLAFVLPATNLPVAFAEE